MSYDTAAGEVWMVILSLHGYRPRQLVQAFEEFSRKKRLEHSFGAYRVKRN